MPDLLDSASNLHAALRRREFSARELLGSTLAVIARLDPAVNAIVQIVAASALCAASGSDARITRGEARSLQGFPVTVKDCFEVAGMVTSAAQEISQASSNENVGRADLSTIAPASSSMSAALRTAAATVESSEAKGSWSQSATRSPPGDVVRGEARASAGIEGSRGPA